MSKITQRVDGIPVYEGNAVYFDDWLRKTRRTTEQEIRNDMLIYDTSKEEVDEAIDELREEFFDWCEENDLSGFDV